MTKFDFTKQEIADIKSKIYLSEDEEKILDMWLKGCYDVEIYMELNISQRTLTRRKTNIKKYKGRHLRIPHQVA